MKLEEAIELVLNEAEVSALGDKSDEQMKILGAVEVVQAFYDNYGKHFSNYSADQFDCHKHNHVDFCDDEEKMIDFNNLTKEDFLSSYSYITEEEYNLTRMKQKNLT